MTIEHFEIKMVEKVLKSLKTLLDMTGLECAVPSYNKLKKSASA
jgi:hypothetical protein